jgi:hypothetical protein
LIVLSAIEYIADKGLTNCIFISSNTQDFSSSSNPNEIHDDLRELFERSGVRFSANIGLAINKEVEANFVSDESVQQVEGTMRLDVIRETLQSIQDYDRQFMASIKAAGDISFAREAFQAVKEADRLFREQIQAAGGFSAIQESLRAIRRYDRQLTEASRIVKGLPRITSSQEVQEGESTPPANEADDQIIKPDNV